MAWVLDVKKPEKVEPFMRENPNFVNCKVYWRPDMNFFKGTELAWVSDGADWETIIGAITGWDEDHPYAFVPINKIPKGVSDGVKKKLEDSYDRWGRNFTCEFHMLKRYGE